MPDPVDLAFAIGLEPADAVAYFRQKGYQITWNWWEMWQEAHAQAFTVAKAMKLDLLQDIRASVDKALAQGLSFGQFQAELEPILRAKGWWGKIISEDGKPIQLGSPYRLQTIFRTNLQSAYMAGRYKQQIENADDRPYWQYVAVMDSRTRPEHALLNGKVFRFDDPFWNTHYPPLGFRCRCRVRALTADQVKERGLIVESGQDNMVWEDRPIGKTDRTQPVCGYRDPVSGRVLFTDVGWSSNPGKDAWGIDLEKYIPDIAKLSSGGFVKASSVDQAMQWAAEHYADKIHFSAGNLNKKWGKKITDNSVLLDKFNEVNRAVGELLERHPNFNMPKIKTVYMTSDKRGRATIVEFKQASVCFADDWSEAIWKRVSKWDDDKGRPWDWVPEESHTAFNVRHEIAHIIDGQFKITSKDQKFINIYKKYGPDWQKHKVSEYASTKIQEFFAEIFAQYTSPYYSDHRNFPSDITDYLDDLLNGRGSFGF